MTNETQEKQTAPAQNTQPMWKKIVAVIIDLLVSLFGFGYVIAMIFGQTTADGFNLQGGPAFIFFGVTAVYFYFGYVVWKKSVGLMLMGIAKK